MLVAVRCKPHSVISLFRDLSDGFEMFKGASQYTEKRTEYVTKYNNGNMTIKPDICIQRAIIEWRWGSGRKDGNQRRSEGGYLKQ